MFSLQSERLFAINAVKNSSSFAPLQNMRQNPAQGRTETWAEGGREGDANER